MTSVIELDDIITKKLQLYMILLIKVTRDNMNAPSTAST